MRKIGIEVSDSTVWRYRPPRGSPPSQSWRAFLDNHVRDIVAIDFFVVPTATFRVLYVFLVMSHDRRRILHFNVTTSPSARWTAQQMREAFPYDTVPRYLLRDRDGIFGADFVRCVKSMGIEEVITAPGSPWQKACSSYCTSCGGRSASFPGWSGADAFGCMLLGRFRSGRFVEAAQFGVVGISLQQA